MRTFAYNDITGEPDAPGHETVVITEAEILDRYYPYWSAHMLKRGGLSPRITPANCIDDFVVVNWAWELPTSTTPAPAPAAD